MRHIYFNNSYLEVQISIHAPLTGCDNINIVKLTKRSISIHAPLTGCDSTFPNIVDLIRISIHAPLTGCDFASYNFDIVSKSISIHAPLTGCDRPSIRLLLYANDFNPRTPYGMRQRDWSWMQGRK